MCQVLVNCRTNNERQRNRVSCGYNIICCVRSYTVHCRLTVQWRDPVNCSFYWTPHCVVFGSVRDIRLVAPQFEAIAHSEPLQTPNVPVNAFPAEQLLRDIPSFQFLSHLGNNGSLQAKIDSTQNMSPSDRLADQISLSCWRFVAFASKPPLLEQSGAQRKPVKNASNLYLDASPVVHPEVPLWVAFGAGW